MSITYLDTLSDRDKADLVRLTRDGMSIRDAAAEKRIRVRTLERERELDPEWSRQLAVATVEGRPKELERMKLDPDFEWHSKQDLLRALQDAEFSRGVVELFETLRDGMRAGDPASIKELGGFFRTYSALLPKRSHATSEAKVDQTNRNLNVHLEPGGSPEEMRSYLKSLLGQVVHSIDRHEKAREFERTIDVTAGAVESGTSNRRDDE